MLPVPAIAASIITMKDQIKSFKDTGKLLSHPHVDCSCGNKTTMFGTNLISRIATYGSLEKLLTEFKCKSCRNVGKAPRVVRVKKARTKKLVIEKNEDQRYDIPVFKNEPPLSIDLVTNADVCRELTRNQCWRPDIYLNNSRSCDKCSLHKNCSSKLKRLARSYI